MLDSGCSKEICDLLSNAAISGFTEYTKNPSYDPMDAFNAAGEYVSDALESELA